MAKELIFNPNDESHRKHYELAHVILMQVRVQLSDAERRRLGGLQDAWESAGQMHADEKVVDDRSFSAFRYTLPEDAEEPISIVLEDAKFELLKKVCEKSQLGGYVQRDQDRLNEFLTGAKIVKVQPIRPSLAANE